MLTNGIRFHIYKHHSQTMCTHLQGKGKGTQLCTGVITVQYGSTPLITAQVEVVANALGLRSEAPSSLHLHEVRRNWRTQPGD
jgi:hypothetical protein